MSSGSGSKRKYHDKGGRRNFNPKRGGPGLLLTCETGREFKCRREALDILNHYMSQEKTEEKEGDEASVGLEEELKKLKSKKGVKGSSMFGLYDTGCRGTVALICHKPGCNLIPPFKIEDKHSKDEKESEIDESKKDEEDQPVDAEETRKSKKTRTEDGNGEADDSKSETEQKEKSMNQSEESSSSDPKWDPVDTVRSIVSDLLQNAKDMPSSRFVTRMIPVQATCFASVEEIQMTTKALLKKFLPLTAKTFAVAPRRRICGNLTTNQIIETVATLVLESIPDCKVQLKNPEVTIVVEVCKTLCGISVVEKCEDLLNFNLVVAREQGDAAGETVGETPS